MQFIKKHYEKIILCIVLLGLAAASALLVFEVSSVQQSLEDNQNKLVATAPKPLKPVDLTANLNALERLQKPFEVVLSGPHNLFNPVQWQRRGDGTLIKLQTGREIGPGAIVIVATKPLETIISYDGVTGTGADARYSFSVTREADKRPANRRKVQRSGGPSSKNDIFLIKEVRGPQDDPTGFVLDLLENGKAVVVEKDKPYHETAGYTADLKYPPENKPFPNSRVDEIINFGQEKYKIVAISEREVVLSANSTTKRTTIKFSAASQNQP